MTSIRFVLHRHPFDPTGTGSSLISRLMMEAASEFGTVSATVLSSRSWESPWPIECIDKPPLRPLRVAVQSLRQHRSLLHARFRIAALRDALKGTTEDRYAVNHTYMAESILDATGPTASERVCINLDVSESEVLRSGTNFSLLRRLEADRTLRDEVRCLSSARSVAGFDERELALYRRNGVAADCLLRPSLAPATRVDVGSAANLLFIGDRSWKPNYLAFERMANLWPAVRRRSPAAELVVLGQGPLPKASTQEGIRVLGHVPSIDPVWAEARALVAPITIGGGVRMKILDAASRGVPVVATPAGVGALSTYLPLTPFVTDDEIVEECATLLNDRTYAQQRADELFEANRQWSADGCFTQDIGAWLQLSAHS